MKRIKNKHNGMTIIETMVALVFLTLGLVPIFSLISSSAQLSNRIRNNLIAANLAQEGIEVVRAIRDASWLNGSAFDQNLPAGDYRVSWDSDSLMAYDSSIPLKINTGGNYNYSSGTNTTYKRRINITKIPSACNCELKVISEVTWTEKGTNRIVTVESHLFNWR